VRLLLATDAFPPVCGGSGWSTYELARGLRARGHLVVIAQPRPGRRSREARYEEFTIHEFGAPAPSLPFVRNYFKNERLHRTFGRFLAGLARRERVDLIHGQHVLSGPAAIAAGESTGLPVVCTVRDYWPVCYWSDLIHDPNADALCPGCTPGAMMTCIRPRAGAAWPLAIPLIPYMAANLARKRQALACAGTIVAVSTTIAHDLRVRAPALARVRLEVVPNPVDVAAIRAARAGRPPLDPPYALYLGKLAPNKGAAHLVSAVRDARLDWPLVVAGEGPDRAAVEAAARAAGVDARFTGWLPRHEALVWLAHATFLVFPSKGPESLSRVLLEAGALGVPVAAMDTGGTRDIIEDEVTGLLSTTPQELARDIARLRQDEALRRRLGAAAAAAVEEKFDAPRVVARMESLYRELLDRPKRDERPTTSD
jgi:glycosyltransferase involved in cell wall biosynthesis